MRKVIGVLVAIVIVLVAAAALVPKLINVNKYHDMAEQQLEQRLGRKVQLGNMSLSLLPPSLRVDNAVIAEDPAFGGAGRPFAEARELNVRVGFWPLLTGKVDVQSLELKNPDVELIRNSQGAWNFSTIGKPEASPAAQQQNAPSGRTAQKQQAPPKPNAQQQNGQPAPSSNAQQKFELGKLQLTDGTVAITDEQKHQSRAVYDHIDLTLEDFAPDKAFTIALAAHLPGQGKQVAKLEGKGGPINDATLLNTPFDGTLKLQQVALSGAQKFLNTPALAGTDAVISGEATVKNDNGKLASNGSLKFDDPVVKGVKIGYPVSLDYDAADDLNHDVIQISRGNLKLGNTPIALTGSINTRNTPALADVKVNASNVSIGEIARLASAFGVAFNPGMQVAGQFNADVHAQGAMNSPALNGTVTASNLAISGNDVPAPVKVPSIQIQLTPQEVRSNQFTASTGGTSVNAQFAAQQYTTPQPIVDATLQTNNANIGELLNLAKAAGVQAANGATGSGTLTLNVHAHGPVKNASVMVFNGNGQVANAQIKTAQMTQPLGVKNANLQFTQNSANINNLDAQAASTHATGNMSVRNFAAPQVQFTLTADKLDVLALEKMFGQQPAQPNNNAQPSKRAANSSFWSVISRAEAQQRQTAPAKPATTAPAQNALLLNTTGGGQIIVGQILYNQLELQNVRTTVTLNRGVITLNPLTTMLYGGQANGSVAMDMRGASTLYNVNLKTQNVDSNRLLAAVSNTKDVLYGQLASTIQAQFATSPNSSDIAQTLNGHVHMNLENGKLANVDMLQQLAAIGKFTSLNKQAGNATNLKQLGGDFDIRNGVATTNNLKAVLDEGSLAATGSANLVNQALDMHVTAVLDKNSSQAVGGMNIGGMAQTALANRNGELVLPVLVTGTFQKPQVSPDVETLAKMKLNNLLPSFSNPGQASSGLLGALTGKGNANGTGGNPASGILNQLKGGQNANQPGAMAGQQGQRQNQQKQNQQNQNPLNNALQGILGGNKPK
ncbi:MAG TPA: AsmA family protein [candidate division Zixibacteria bacterium]|nr:AsmA family protein [candidate division Zixibacteria bacterium]